MSAPTEQDWKQAEQIVGQFRLELPRAGQVILFNGSVITLVGEELTQSIAAALQAERERTRAEFDALHLGTVADRIAADNKVDEARHVILALRNPYRCWCGKQTLRDACSANPDVVHSWPCNRAHKFIAALETAQLPQGDGE